MHKLANLLVILKNKLNIIIVFPLEFYAEAFTECNNVSDVLQGWGWVDLCLVSVDVVIPGVDVVIPGVDVVIPSVDDAIPWCGCCNPWCG